MSKTIMCVDDEINLLKLYQQELGDQGYEVISASSGEKALKMMESTPVDLVVLDIKMEDTDGLEVLAEIRKKAPQLPVILHSAYSTYKSDFQSWLANDYLVKTSDLSQLMSRITELLSKDE